MATKADDESTMESDISDWEIDEGVPQFGDQFIQQYLQGREALIDQEKMQRSDYAFRQSLTPLAKEACSIVDKILEEEQRTVWQHDRSDENGDEDDRALFPGMMFPLAKTQMEKTKSWQIVRKLPKGALLHAHMDATLDVDVVIENALKTEGVAMSADRALDSKHARDKGQFSFQYRKSTSAPGSTIWTEQYQPTNSVSLSEASQTFPDGGAAGFKAWLMKRCTITIDESLQHHYGVDHIWQKFASCFLPLNNLESYEPIFRPSLQDLLRQFAADGIRWADLRCVFINPFFLAGSDRPCKDNTEFLQVWRDEVAQFQKTEEGKGFWGCRFIWTSLRFWGKKQIIEHMKDCISMKKKFPDLICGYDLVGQEDTGRPLADLIPELFWFKKACMENGVEIPFFFHAGECLGDGDDTDQNLFDAILLGTRRIGHGFSLYKHPLLVEMIKTKKILIESCPISNEILRLTSGIKAHTLPALLARGVSCSLSNDDPSILGYGCSGVTHDYWQALRGWRNVGLAGLGSLAENSVRWAAYAPDQSAKEWNKDIRDGINGVGLRAERMREWRAEWDRFCEWIVLEFAIQYGGGDEEE